MCTLGFHVCQLYRTSFLAREIICCHCSVDQLCKYETPYGIQNYTVIKNWSPSQNVAIIIVHGDNMAATITYVPLFGKSKKWYAVKITISQGVMASSGLMLAGSDEISDWISSNSASMSTWRHYMGTIQLFGVSQGTVEVSSLSSGLGLVAVYVWEIYFLGQICSLLQIPLCSVLTLWSAGHGKKNHFVQCIWSSIMQDKIIHNDKSFVGDCFPTSHLHILSHSWLIVRYLMVFINCSCPISPILNLRQSTVTCSCLNGGNTFFFLPIWENSIQWYLVQERQ